MRRHSTTSLVLLVTFTIGTIRVLSQSAAEQKLSFEVASIKQNKTPPSGVIGGPGCRGTDRGPQTVPLGRCIFINQTFETLIGIASWKTGPAPRFAKKPDWLETERYDVEAVSGDPTHTSIEQLREMLGTLLIERLQLRFHRQTDEVDGYALTLAKERPKLEPSSASGRGILRWTVGTDAVTGGKVLRLTATNLSISLLAEGLESGGPLKMGLGRPVLDQTGISGHFDFNLEWTPDSWGIGTSVFSAIQDQLGLKLESRKVSVEVLVIDSVQKPTVN